MQFVKDVPHDDPSNNLECFTIKTHVTKSVMVYFYVG